MLMTALKMGLNRPSSQLLIEVDEEEIPRRMARLKTKTAAFIALVLVCRSNAAQLNIQTQCLHFLTPVAGFRADYWSAECW